MVEIIFVAGGFIHIVHNAFVYMVANVGEFAAVCVRREHYVVKHKYVGQVFAHSVERRVVSGAVAPPFKFYNDVFVSFIEFVNERLIVGFFGVYVATCKNKLNDFAAVERVPGFVVVYLIAASAATGKSRKR